MPVIIKPRYSKLRADSRNWNKMTYLEYFSLHWLKFFCQMKMFCFCLRRMDDGNSIKNLWQQGFPWVNPSSGLCSRDIGLCNRIIGPVYPILGFCNQIIGPVHPIVGIFLPIIGPDHPIICLCNPIIGFVKPVQGHFNPIIGSCNPIIGSWNPIIGSCYPINDLCNPINGPIYPQLQEKCIWLTGTVFISTSGNNGEPQKKKR